ncbi:MAG: trypsin-like peptidase domain-containing protein [Candidatus Pacebacteria bacterium]|nr:trypsin-like peptidase domain-containing protein [Candidatus Paceibacterota bacterium]
MRKKLFWFSVILSGILAVQMFVPLSIAQANFITDFFDSIKEKLQPIGESVKEGQDALKEKILEKNVEEAVTGIKKDEKTEEVSLYKPAADYENAIIEAVEKTDPAVVSIIVTKDLPVIENCPVDLFSNIPQELRQFFELPEGTYSQPCQKGVKKQEVGGGSGFLVSNDGLILTNKHVVNDETASYTILTNDGKKYEAKVLAKDPLADIAIVKADISGLATVKLGDSDSVKLGQTAIAIGNALGEFRNTVSVGVISGLARTVTATDGNGGGETIEGVFQTDAAINPGNSGGPLLNLRGEVIGINTAIASGAENIAFTIPINMAKKAIDSVKTTGKISTPYIGVRYYILSEEDAKEKNIPYAYGALIVKGENGETGISAGSPAEKVGLKEGDVILEIGGEKIDLNHSLMLLIRKHEVGERVGIKVYREGKEIFLYPVLEERK